MKFIKTMLLTAFISSALSVHADVLSVSDIELLNLAKDQLTNIKSQLDKLNEQKKILEKSQGMMEGHYDYASKFDNPLLSSWEHSGKDWGSLMNGARGAESDPLTILAKQIEQEFPLASKDKIFSATKESEQARLFDLLSKTTMASRATSKLTYNRVDDELAMLEALQKEIEKSPNQKATLDLIARINIEQAKLMAYKIKSDAVSNELISLQSQQEVSDAKWASEFFKWH
ncbi:MAG: type IV secretion system protein [Silvanigrellaceae bacterium]|nr:type IV secretion system protein [Silvanigrellaceae bacterium]